MITRRRAVIQVIACSALLHATQRAWPQATATVRRIGLLVSGAEKSAATQQGAAKFREALQRAGWDEARNLAIEWRFAEGRDERLPALADELVRANVEVIVASSNAAIGAAIAATRRAARALPIVMYAAWEPVEAGFIASFARPGGNVTGTTAAPHELNGKVYELLKAAVPAARRVAVLQDASFVTALAGSYTKTARDAASALGIDLWPYPVRRPDEWPMLFERIAANGVDALMVEYGPLVRNHYAEIASFAIKRKLPAIGPEAQFARAGGLLYYGPDAEELLPRTVSYIDRILRGARPADLPVEMPTRYLTTINLRTARAIGHTIPQSVLLRADEVIE